MQEEIRTALGIKVREFEKLPAHDEALKAKVKALAWDGIKKGYGIAVKHERYGMLSTVKMEMLGKLKAELGDKYTPVLEKSAKAVYEDLKYDYMRDITVNGGRIGGRRHDEVRQITCEIQPLPRTHGSALFTRGETQAL